MDYNSNFEYDLELGKVKEKERHFIDFCKKVYKKYNISDVMLVDFINYWTEMNPDGKELYEIFSYKKIEVKTDFKANETGNVFIEYESRGKKSGIATSLADYYCIAIENSFHIMKPELLKEKCRKYLGTKRDVLGGDNNTSKGILLPVIELV